MMIEPLHDNFFTFPNKKKSQWIRISTKAKSDIVLHPNFSFDPTPGGGYAQDIELEFLYEDPARNDFPMWNNFPEVVPNQIFHQEFDIELPLDSSLVGSFVSYCLESFASIASPDETFWYETGYWTAKHRQDLFMGMGLTSLRHAFKQLEGVFSCCLANRDSIVMIKGDPKNSATIIDLYITNAFLPFTEVADIFRESVRKLSKYKSLIEELILEATIHSRHSFENQFLIRPKAVVLQESYPVLAMIENPVKQNSQAFDSLEYIIGSTSGGLLDTDFAESKTFELRVDQWNLKDTNLFQFFFVRKGNLDRLRKVQGINRTKRFRSIRFLSKATKSNKTEPAKIP